MLRLLTDFLQMYTFDGQSMPADARLAAWYSDLRRKLNSAPLGKLTIARLA